VSDRHDALLPAFAGFLFALAVTTRAATPPVLPALLSRIPDPLAGERSLDPDRMCLRDLRRLPSIGPARALAIARARFDLGLRGGPWSWDRIEGIGSETVRTAQSWLAAERSARPSPRNLSAEGMSAEGMSARGMSAERSGAYTSPRSRAEASGSEDADAR
jgi:hypothetical protein